MGKKTRSIYEEPKPGEWVNPIMKGYKLVCCDCGLVHKMDFRVFVKEKKFKDGSYIEGKIGKGASKLFASFRCWRDNRATAAHRREKRKRDE